MAFPLLQTQNSNSITPQNRQSITNGIMEQGATDVGGNKKQTDIDETDGDG